MTIHRSRLWLHYVLCHASMSWPECSWPMYEAQLQILGVISVKPLGGVWGAYTAEHHISCRARWDVSNLSFPSFYIFLHLLSACCFPTNCIFADKLWDGLWLGTPMTSQSLIRTCVRGFCGTDMTLVPRIGPMKTPMRIIESSKDI